MVRIDVQEYIDELKGLASQEKEIDLYSLKKELINLNESSKVFENFEKESMIVDKKVFEQIQDLGLLIKLRNLTSEIKNKKQINEKLHSLHFNLNLFKNVSLVNDVLTLKSVFNAFLYNNETKIDNVINELNDFKAKLDKIKAHHSKLLPRSLDNKLEIESRCNKHIEQLYSIHKRQKNVLISIVKLLLKLTKKHIRNPQKFK